MTEGINNSTINEDLPHSVDTTGVWLARITGFCSILGSLVVINLILGNHSQRREKLSRVPNRLVLAIGIVDIPSSIAIALSTLAVPPVDDQEKWSHDDELMGNTASCSAQGFFVQIGMAIPLYTAMLCIFYLCFLCYGLTEKEFIKRFEPLIHLLCFVYPLSSAFIGAFSDSFNDIGVAMCWFAPYPWNCQIDTEIECTRGKHTDLYRFIFSVLPIFASFLTVTISMILIVRFVNKWAKSNNQNNSRPTPQQKETATQAILYISIFILTYIFHIIHIILHAIEGEEKNKNDHVFPEVVYLHFTLFPLQGFWNAVVYTRPIILQLRQHNPGKSLAWATKILLFHPNSITLYINSSSFNTSRASTENIIIDTNEESYISSLSAPTI